MTPAVEWPLLILGLLGWVFAAALATVIALAVIALAVIAERRAIRLDLRAHEDEAIALTKETPCSPLF